jgi:hypothetical protein
MVVRWSSRSNHGAFDHRFAPGDGFAVEEVCSAKERRAIDDDVGAADEVADVMLGDVLGGGVDLEAGLKAARRSRAVSTRAGRGGVGMRIWRLRSPGRRLPPWAGQVGRRTAAASCWATAPPRPPTRGRGRRRLEALAVSSKPDGGCHS